MNSAPSPHHGGAGLRPSPLPPPQNRGAGPSPPPAGFTIIELLVAMAIFSVLGIALIALLSQSTAFLTKGQAGSEVQDTLENIDRALAEDFANVYIRPTAFAPLPDVRFVCDRIPFDTDGDGSADTWTQRVAFVRSLKGEGAETVFRNSGSKPGAMGVLDGSDDAKEIEENDLGAPGGKEEVTWLLVPGKKDDEPGVGTLYRGERWPLRGKGSLVRQRPVGEPLPERERQLEEPGLGVATRGKAAEACKPVQGGVLHFSLRFWTRHTKPESARFIVNGRVVDEVPPEVGGGGLTATWDSTRAILPAGRGTDQFFLGKGPASLADPVDDIFPSRVRVLLVVDRIGKDAATGELTQSIGIQDNRIPVDGTKFAVGTDPASRYVKIDREWIRWSARDDRGFLVEERGARGTKKEPHDRGAAVRSGTTLVREYSIPSYREDWND